MLALTGPTRSYDNGKNIGREFTELFRGDSVCPTRLQATARPSQIFHVTHNLHVIEYIRCLMLCMHPYLTVMSPLDFQGRNHRSAPDRITQIRHDWKSESVLWQPFQQATAQGVECRELLSAPWLREGSDPGATSDRSALTPFFRGQKSIFCQSSPPVGLLVRYDLSSC
jgi:hypothetical protein